MKTVLITGASKGIGRSIATLFSQKGWNVAATVKDPTTTEPFVGNIKIYPLDVRSKHSIDNCIAQVLNDFGQIDAIVNNAGVYSTSPLECISKEDLDNLIQTNINGVLYMTQAILPHFRERGIGVIANIASVAGRVTFPYQSVYHTSKWAIEGLSESLYYELRNLNVKVKVIEPGMVRTNLYRSVLNPTVEQYPSAYKDNFKRWHQYLINNYENGYNPALDAKTVFKAVSDSSFRLRYTSDFTTKMVLSLRTLLPLCIFRKIIYSISKLK